MSNFMKHCANIHKRRNFKTNWVFFDEISKERNFTIEQYFQKKNPFFRFNNSFFICIFWIRSNFKRVFFVNSENLNMKNLTNWFAKFLMYYFFLMIFFFHNASLSSLKSFVTQISLIFIFWFLRLKTMNIFAELIERKDWTKIIKSFFLNNLNLNLWMNFIINWNIRTLSLINFCFLIWKIRTFAD